MWHCLQLKSKPKACIMTLQILETIYLLYSTIMLFICIYFLNRKQNTEPSQVSANLWQNIKTWWSSWQQVHSYISSNTTLRNRKSDCARLVSSITSWFGDRRTDHSTTAGNQSKNWNDQKYEHVTSYTRYCWINHITWIMRALRILSHTGRHCNRTKKNSSRLTRLIGCRFRFSDSSYLFMWSL